MKSLIYLAVTSVIAAVGIAVSRPDAHSVLPPIVSQTAPIDPPSTPIVSAAGDVVGHDRAGKPALNHAVGW